MSITDTVTIFRRGRVFDGKQFLDGEHDVVVAKGIVQSVLPSGAQTNEPSETGVTIVDCLGATVMPGMIDTHVHLLVTAANPVQNALDPFSLAYYRSVNNARAMLESGITSARDLAGADAGLKDAIDRGITAGPRLSIAIGAMSITGGHGDNWLRSGVKLHVVNSDTAGKPNAIADGREEVRKVAREMFRAGADVIKICATGGVMSTNDHPDHSQFSQEEIEVIVEEATAHGSYVAAHAIGTIGIKNALRAGARSIEHAIYVDDEAIQMMLDANAYMVPTLTAPRQVIEHGSSGMGLPENMIEKAKSVVDQHLENFSKAVKAGVKIAMGSDAGIGLHGNSLAELPVMAEGGMSLEGVLAAATSVAAELLPEDWKVGQLRPDYTADILVIDDQLTSVSQLATIPTHLAQVWKAGARVR